MKSLRGLPLFAAASVLLPSTLLFAQQAAPAVRITAPIDASQLVTIKGSVHPLANAQNDRGPASPGMQLERMHLILKRSPAQESALRQLIQDQNTPGSASYHQWLTPAQFAARFGPSTQDIATVENWLSDQGFTINKIEPGNQTLDITGTVGLLQSAFHTQIRKYMVNGQLHYANANDPQIPAALAPVIGGFVSLNNFHYKSYAQKLGEATYDPSTGRAKPTWTIGSGSFDYTKYNFVLSPADYAVQYDLPSTLKGDGQTIAIVNEANINVYLVNQFRSLFGLPANPPQIIIDGNDPGVDGINNPDGPNGASVEAYLDVEWAGAVAPNATIELVIAGDTSVESGLALAAEHAVYSNVAPVISVSFGGCELDQGGSNTFWNSLWQQAAAQGQTVLVSTGDSGSAGCDYGGQYATNGLGINGLASTPWNVAVGGTDFYYTSWNSGSSATIENELSTYWKTTASNTSATESLLKPVPEQPWNSSQYGDDLFNEYTLSQSTNIGAGSGGASSAAICSGTYSSTFSAVNGYCSVKPTGYPKPAWQTGSGVPSDNVRDIPDVSLFAANGYNDSFYPICATDADCQPVTSGTVQIFGVGGTSAAAPSFAGIMALVNQKYGRQGQADTILYPLKAQFPAAFHDISHGSISVPCEILPTLSTNCISVTNPAVIQTTNSSGNTISVTEGQIGSGTTAAYNAAAGYNLATGLGSVDAAVLINDWGSVQLPSANVTFNATPTSITHGQSVTVSGAVTGSGTPTGSVAVMSDSTEPSQQGQSSYALDSSGKYNGTTTTLPGGSYNIWASYSGDAKNGATPSAKIPITVSPEASGIAFGLFQDKNIYSGSGSYVTSNITTSIDYGTQLMLSARVAPSADVAKLQTCTTSTTTACPTYTAPTGTIAFKDSSATLNTALINTEGDAEYNAPFSVGSHSVSASYSGDNSYNASNAGPITFTVAQDLPTILMSTQETDQNGDFVNGPGWPTVVTVLVENSAQYKANNTSSSGALFPVPVATPTGAVTISASPSLSFQPSSATLSPFVDQSTGAIAGVATFVIPAGSLNSSYSIKATYAGDTNYKTTSNTQNVSIVTTSGDGLINTTITGSISGAISPSSTVTISGAVKASSGSGVPTGYAVLYSSGGYPTYSTLNSNGAYSLTVDSATLLQGTNEMTLVYIPDSNSQNTYNPSSTVLSTNISNPLSDFSLIPQSTIVPVTAGDSGDKVILNLASNNSFSGSVALTCTTPTGLNFTCSLSPSSVSLSGGSGSSTLTITAPLGTAQGNYNVSVTGTDSTGKYIHTLAITADVTGQVSPSFALSNSGAISVKAGANSGNTSTITVTPMGGFTGTVALTCAVTSAPAGAVSSPTCTVDPSVNITSTTALTATLAVDTTATTTGGAYTVTVTGKNGAITATTPVSVTVSVPGLDLTNSGSITLQNPGDSGTSTITATPNSGFTGTVNLACAVSSQPTGATNIPTCDFTGNPITISGAAAGTATLNVHSQSTTTLGAYQVTVTATAGTITTTTVVGVTVGVPDFSLTASPTSITLKAGATSGNTSAISITPKNGFTGNITLTCAITPTAASDPATCSVSPSSANVTSASAVQTTLTITTTAATTAANEHKTIFWPTAGGGTLLACLLFFWIPKKRRSWFAMVGLLVFFISIAGMACGGGGGSTGGGGGGGNPGTTPGTYTVTVTGTSGSLNHTTTVSLTVQ
ncbi:MAG TPA: protease pro-enzyme activation domain-containing protein [Terracidiphilus sp.]|nr:protease pro-enzyme activation domain-containing protein [Terracidiphilus sp.]